MDGIEALERYFTATNFPVGLLLAAVGIVGVLFIERVVFGRIHELVGQDEAAQRLYWSRATAGFALGQAAAGYVFSYIFAQTQSHLHLFSAAAVVLFVAFVVDFAIGYIYKTPVTIAEHNDAD